MYGRTAITLHSGTAFTDQQGQEELGMAIKGLRERWIDIRNAILSKWGHAIDASDLEEPLDDEQMCALFGEKCGLARQDARREVDRILDELQSRPSGV